MSLIPVAVLDDYSDTAPEHFSKIPGITIVKFPNTILPTDEASIDAVATKLQPFEIIATMRERTPFRAELINRLPNLKLLVTTGLRNLAIDVQAAKARGIIVAGTSGGRDLLVDTYGQLPKTTTTYDATTQHSFSLLLALTSRVYVDNHSVRESGSWQTGLGVGLGEKTYGCIGLGRLGARAARTAILGFGMKVIAWSANLSQEKADEQSSAMGLPAGSIRVVGKEELLKTADVVSIHYILSDRSRGLIGKQDLEVMKSTAILINTSRGPIVDEKALLDTLNQGNIRGAGLDVFNIEPLPKDSPWRTTNWGEDGKSMVVLSPHMGYVVEDVIHRMYAEEADTITKWLKGEEVPDLLQQCQ